MLYFSVTSLKSKTSLSRIDGKGSGANVSPPDAATQDFHTIRLNPQTHRRWGLISIMPNGFSRSGQQKRLALKSFEHAGFNVSHWLATEC